MTTEANAIDYIRTELVPRSGVEIPALDVYTDYVRAMQGSPWQFISFSQFHSLLRSSPVKTVIRQGAPVVLDVHLASDPDQGL